MTTRVELDWEPLPQQWELLDYQPPPEAEAGPLILPTFGGWGSGKTTGVGMAFALDALKYGHNAAYGKKRPKAVVMAPTLGLAVENQLELVEALLPNELIRRRWGMPKPRLLLANGLEIAAVSADATYDGTNLVLVWLDEIHREVYANDPTIWTNMVARLRDSRTAHKHTKAYVSGLPTSGWVRDTFEIREPNPNASVRMWATRQNSHLAPGVLSQIKKATPAGMEGSFLDGQWMPIPDALYPQFSDGIHLTDEDGDPAVPVSIGVDVGNRSAIEVGQRKTVPGSADVRLHVIDEVLGDGLSVGELMHRFAATGWQLVPGKSEIYVDPTLRRDEVNAIYHRFPKIRVVQRARDDEYHDVWRGVRLVQSALRNSDQQTRLTFRRALAANKRGVIESMVRLRINPRTGTMAVDDQRDHPNDALRYLACGVLGRQASQPSASTR